MTAAPSAALDPGRRGISGSLLGMILFVTSETMFFGALFGAYFTIRFGTVGEGGAWPPPGIHLHVLLPAILTAVLVSSSVTVHRGVALAKGGDITAARRWIGVTAVLGAAFLAGQAVEYALLDFSLGDGAYATLFFTLTGFHGLHVAIGLVILLVTLLAARRGRISEQRHGLAEAAGFYWHFVDLVWVLLFVTIYVLR